MLQRIFDRLQGLLSNSFMTVSMSKPLDQNVASERKKNRMYDGLTVTVLLVSMEIAHHNKYLEKKCIS